ncbi:MAG: PDZ domain-containing protein [Phycisphaerae bacterium]
MLLNIRLMKILFVLFTFLGILVSSCCTIPSRLEPKNFDLSNGSQGEHLKQTLLKGVQFENSFQINNIKVFYERGLKNQAERIASRYNNDWAYIHQVTGFQVSYDHIHLYLVRSTRNASMALDMFRERGNKIGIILYVVPGKEKYEEILANNYVPYIVTFHEIMEDSLLWPQTGPRVRVLNDLAWVAYGCIPCRKYRYTRWFREGFSEYVSFLVYDSLLSEFKSKHYPLFVFSNQKERWDHPYSSLRKIGRDLFTWIQFDYVPTLPITPITGRIDCLEKCSDYPGSAKNIIDYYRAALCLFLNIRDQYGDEGIKKIILGLESLKKADGPSIVKLVNKTLNTDIVKMAANFHFPYAGMGTFYIQPDLTEERVGPFREGLYVMFLDPNGLAGKAGIQKGDYIIQMNGHNILTNFDYERTLNKYKDQKSVNVKVYRKGKGELSLEMKLSN